jgi:hypothetical protein
MDTQANSRPIYDALALHQQTDDEWELRELLAWLQLWKDRFISRFKLQLQEISLCVDWLHWRRLGHFRYGHNGFGLVGEIALNRRYLACREPWQHLGTLLHELIHAWQDRHGRPGKGNYHNREFRARALRYGLVIDERGYTEYLPDSPFFELLREYEIAFPRLSEPTAKSVSRTKLKKWSCSCIPPVNVRVAVQEFHARCLVCGQIFRKAGRF